MKKNISICVALLAVTLLVPGSLSAKNSFKKMQLTLRGGLDMFSAIGDASDYTAGENDFPVTPAYQAPVFGIGLAYFTSSSLAIEFNVRYGLSATVDLRDPSDGEPIAVDTPQHLMAAISLFQYVDLSRRMKLFISLAGGLEYRMAETREYTSALGSEIIISAPAKPVSPLVGAGVGFTYMFSDSLGISLACQGAYIVRDPAQFVISPALSLELKF